MSVDKNLFKLEQVRDIELDLQMQKQIDEQASYSDAILLLDSAYDIIDSLHFKKQIRVLIEEICEAYEYHD